MRNFRVLAFASLLSLTSLSAIAQVDTAQVSGVVTDSSGAVVPNAQIQIVSKSTGVTRTVTANNSGSYTVLALPAGSYTETVMVNGFAGYSVTYTLAVGAKSIVDIKLTPGSNTTIEVAGTDSAVEVNTTTPEISQVISPKQVLDLPSLSRDPYDFVNLSGNAAADPGGSTSRGANVSFSGQRAAGTEILLDGVENADNYDATVGQSIPLDSVQEYRIITNGFDSQYGRASGGVVNLITKGGSNSFHGSLYEYNRISALASNTWYENATGLGGDHFTRNQFGYSVGGPIFRDKLFFFSNTEWNRIRSNGQQLFEVPTASFIASSNAATQAFFNAYGTLDSKTKVVSTVPVTGFATAPLQLVSKTASIDAGAGTPQDLWMTMNRFDYTVNSKVSMFFRTAQYSQVLPSGTNSLSPYSGFDTGTTSFNQTYLYNLSYAITPSFLSNSKVSYSRYNTSQPLNGGASPTLYLNQANTASTDGSTGISIAFPGYLPLSPGNALPFGGPANVYQFQQNFTWVKGQHTITFGGSFFQLRDNRTFGAYYGAVEQVSKTGTNYVTALNALQQGNIYSFAVAIDPKGHYPCYADVTGAAIQTPSCTIDFPASSPSFERQNTFNDGDWYVQDSYKITPRVNVMYGLRWEYYGVQHNNNRNLESNFFFGSGNTVPAQVASGQVLTTPNSPVGGLIAQKFTNYAPRIGVAIDPFGDGKWSIRGGFGISYERNFGNVTYNTIQNPPNYANVTLTSNSVTQYNVYTSNFGPFAAQSGSVALPPTFSLRALDPHMPTAYTENWLAAIQHQLSSHDLIAVEYSGARGVHQYAIAGFNGIGYGTFLGDEDPTAYGLNRLNHQYGGINQRTANGASNYNALNIRYESQNLSRYGLSLSVNYTYAHALDNLSSTFSESGGNFNLGYLNPYNPSLDWGNADYDVRHRVSIGGIYQPSFLEFRSNHVAHALFGGLEFAPIAVLRTGTPFTVYDCTNGMNACPRISPASDVKYHGKVGAYNGGNAFDYLDIPSDSANTFVNSQGYSDFPDTLGGYQNPGIGRNQWYGPGNVSFDLGAYKNFQFGANDRYRIQFRAEFYNVLNHSNYYPIIGTADYAEVSNVNVEKGTPGGGSPSSADERRNTQLALRLEF